MNMPASRAAKAWLGLHPLAGLRARQRSITSQERSCWQTRVTRQAFSIGQGSSCLSWMYICHLVQDAGTFL